MNRVLAWEVPDLVIYTGGTNLPEALISWTLGDGTIFTLHSYRSGHRWKHQQQCYPLLGKASAAVCTDWNTLGYCVWEPRWVNLMIHICSLLTPFPPPSPLPPFLPSTDDLSLSKGTRRDLLLFDTSYNLSLSKFGPVSQVCWSFSC